MVTHNTIIDYFIHAGPVVKFVMLLLFVASIYSWTLIIQRVRFFKTIQDNYETFIKRFVGSSDINRLYSDIDSRYDEREGLVEIFYEGYKEFLQLKESPGLDLMAIQRVMQISQAKESWKLEKHLSVFASIGSISPFVGLFGTVWGIMTSFQALGNAQQATIAMVAPGISEALIATALGLFTAIPAVIAYNRFTNNANNILNRYDIFQEQLLSKLNHSLLLDKNITRTKQELEYA